ncbi:MAG: tRNA (adenosine(37)-N6)-dimethylallyltransferase MiaA [Lentisphaeria bacterium]|nr:tRNA (adenosine(37)-N6)-dimethylallyltransferase MiaA [Lentisphaeria bacterium]
MAKNNKIIIITGPTATGKTALAVEIAKKFNSEIISADSRQVYKFMDLGTGKDLEEYGDVPYHLIDIAHPNEVFSLYDFIGRTQKAMQEIWARGRNVLICGGTPLYINSILQRYRLEKNEVDESLREKLNSLPLNELQDMLKKIDSSRFDNLNADDRINPLRVRRQIELALSSNGDESTIQEWQDFESLVIGVYYPREVVRARVDERLKKRFDLGMIEEVKFLHEVENVSYEKLEKFGLEYREIAKYLQGEYNFEELYSQLLNKIRQFVKRQDIFFRKMEREGVEINWVANGDVQVAAELVKKFLQ